MSSPNWWGFFKSFFDGTQSGGAVNESIPVGDIPDNYNFSSSPDSRELLRTIKGNLRTDLGLRYYKNVNGNLVPFTGFVSILKRVWRDGTTTIEFIDGRTNEAILPMPLSGENINLQVYNKHPGDFVLPEQFRTETDLTKVEDYLKSQLVPEQPEQPPPQQRDLKSFNITPTQQIKEGWTIQAWDSNTRVTNYRIVFNEQLDGSYDIYFVENGTNKRLWSNVGRTGLNLTRNQDGSWKIPKETIERADGRPLDSLIQGYKKQAPEPEPPAPKPAINKISVNVNQSIYNLKAMGSDGTIYDNYIIEYWEEDGFLKMQFKNEAGQPLFPQSDIFTDSSSLVKNLGDNIYGIQGATKDQFNIIMSSNFPPSEEPQPPTPPDEPTGPRELGTINSNQFEGLIWETADGKTYEGNVKGIFQGDVDNDGKNEMYFQGDDGQYLQVSKADGYVGDLPQPDTKPTRGRRLPSGEQVIEYEDDKSFLDSQIWFDSGFNINKKKEISDLLDMLDIRGLMLYKKAPQTNFTFFNTGDKIIDSLHVVGFVKHNLKPLDKKKIQPLKIEEGEEGEEQPEQEFLTGTATTTGGEEEKPQFDLFSVPQLCGGTPGTGRRLKACGPEEPPAQYNMFKSKPVSNSELLNFERNIEERERKEQLTMETTYVQMRETTDESELISMYATYSSASYIPEGNRPDSLFGLDLDKEHSSNNMVTYIGRSKKNGVISIRGTKPGNITDLLSDAIILTGYEEQLSIRFEESLRKVKAIMDAHPNTKFTLSSHSLGGTINEFIINELENTPYDKRIQAISFNPGKAPNVKSKRAEKLTDFINNASVLKALKEEDPRFLPIMSSLQRNLGITAEQLNNPEIMTNEAELQNLINNYPQLTESFNGLINRLGGIQTLEQRTAEAERWIQENEAILGSVNYTASLMNLVKTKILFDLAIKLFDFSTNFTIDEFIKRESAMDNKLNKAVKPYDVLWSEGDNVIFKFKSDPISLHHSFLEEDKQNVRTYDKGESIFKVGLEGRLKEGLQSHGIGNFIKDKHKGLIDHSETWSEYFNNLLNDNVESFSEVLNGVKNKLSEKEKELIQKEGWSNFLGLF